MEKFQVADRDGETLLQGGPDYTDMRLWEAEHWGWALDDAIGDHISGPPDKHVGPWIKHVLGFDFTELDKETV